MLTCSLRAKRSSYCRMSYHERLQAKARRESRKPKRSSNAIASPDKAVAQQHVGTWFLPANPSTQIYQCRLSRMSSTAISKRFHQPFPHSQHEGRFRTFAISSRASGTVPSSGSGASSGPGAPSGPDAPSRPAVVLSCHCGYRICDATRTW